MLDETVGERVARLRERRHLTQLQLSDTTEGTVSEAWIAALEKNRLKMPPNLEKLQALAEPLGVAYSYLLAPLGLRPTQDGTKGDDWREMLWDDARLDDEGKTFLERAIRLEFEAAERRDKTSKPPPEKRRAG